MLFADNLERGDSGFICRGTTMKKYVVSLSSLRRRHPGLTGLDAH